MIHSDGWVCTVTSTRETTPFDIVCSDDTWIAPGDWIIDHLDTIIDWYGGSLICIKLEPKCDGIPE